MDIDVVERCGATYTSLAFKYTMVCGREKCHETETGHRDFVFGRSWKVLE